MAAQQLESVRRRLVNTLSNPLIKQLLDDLFEDNVLNDGEKDAILEENPSRADKARCLIDIVKRKGDDASSKLIAHLQERDPLLYNDLDWPQPQ
ncbi:caspase-1-A-like [Melanotaenia boesemani]|uniref:caspase-1-A-like n=1 Tax=Melanotaenia boesemani TaxID=1250792 RepID=UPI001C04F785|nr:caspase-1-A-like [Melanotaenia boesemani]